MVILLERFLYPSGKFPEASGIFPGRPEMASGCPDLFPVRSDPASGNPDSAPEVPDLHSGCPDLYSECPDGFAEAPDLSSGFYDLFSAVPEKGQSRNLVISQCLKKPLRPQPLCEEGILSFLAMASMARRAVEKAACKL